MEKNYILFLCNHLLLILAFYYFFKPIASLRIITVLVISGASSFIAVIYKIPLLCLVALAMNFIVGFERFKKAFAIKTSSYVKNNLYVLMLVGLILNGANLYLNSVFVFCVSAAIGIICLLLVSVVLVLNSKKAEVSTLVKIDTAVDADKDFENLNSTLATIHLWFDESECYLKPEYSIDQLQKDIKIDRKIISQAINKVEGVNFYQLIAQYRIKYAKSVLQNNDRYTLESLSTACGFYSKSSFNKYFKMFEGETPSMFKLKKI